MKKITTFLAIFILGITITAQAQQFINYQGVARNNAGEILVTQAVGLRLSILSGSATGAPVYVETHARTTDAFGLFTLQIGQGTVVSGQFDTINWGANALYLKVEIDPTGGTNYTFAGTSQFASVPYALNAKNGTPDGHNPGDMLYWNGTSWIPVPAGSNGQALVFNNGLPVWGGAQLPTVSITSGVCYSTDAQYVNGNISNNGGSILTDYGFCYSTSPDPSILSSLISTSYIGNPNQFVDFQTTISGLTPNTTYYVRAYATNSVGAGYSNTASFTTRTGLATLTTTPVTGITATTAVSGGDITDDGGSAIVTRGVCWSTVPNPTIADSKTTDGSGWGIFTSNLTGLLPNTTYFIRAYATNSVGTTYGNELNFIYQSGIVAISTTSVSALSSASASVDGLISSDGGTTIINRGVCYGTSASPTTANSVSTSGSGGGSFTAALTGLTSGTTYFARAFAINSADTTYGNELSFVTAGSCPGFVTISHTYMAGVSPADAAPFNGTYTYNTVLANDAWGGKCWITKNIGATAEATSFADADPGRAGWYFQFNRKQGFYQEGYTRTPNTTWIYPIDENSTWTAANDPCTQLLGNLWRIPTISEWESFRIASFTNGGMQNGSISPAFNSYLKIHAAGFIYYYGGFEYRGSYGNHWSSTAINATEGNFFQYHSSSGYTTSGSKSYGNSIRCLRATNTSGTVNITTTPVSAIFATTAISGGNITDDGGSTVTARGVCYSTSPGPTTADSIVACGSGGGMFTANLSGLTPSSTYYIRAFATNSNDTFYGDELSFTTTPEGYGVVILSTTALTSITSLSAVSGGSITSDGGVPISNRGVCWSTAQNPTIADFNTSDGTGTGSFSSSLTSLAPGTTYYVRAYATNSLTTWYGNELTLATPAQLNYSFSSAAGTYSQITGGTVFSSGAVDDDSYLDLPIGFVFSYNGTASTNFSVNANGFLGMGATISSSYTPISTGATNNIISPLGRDLQGNAGGSISYLTTGAAPNRVLTVQWSDYRPYYETGYVYNFQIKLYETSNKIEFVYGSFISPALYTAQVGLRGATNAFFMNRTTTSNWAASAAGAVNTATMTLNSTVVPSNGLVYTWTPY